MRFKTLRENPKKKISASGGFRLLQMVSKPNTGRCASKEDEPRRGMDTGQCASEDVGPKGGCIVRSHIDWRRE